MPQSVTRRVYMRVLILGSGAKDHAIAWWFSQSSYLSELFIAPGNVATDQFAINLGSIDPSDPVEVYEACVENRIESHLRSSAQGNKA